MKKTKLIVFNRKPALAKKQWELKTENYSLKSSLVARFLGIFFHANLKWTDHFNEVFSRCEHSIRTITCLRRTWWGAEPDILVNLYRSLIQSRLEYGSFLFSNLNNKEKDNLVKIQVKALRVSLGYMMSTPKNVILAEAKVMPIYMRAKYLALNFLTRAL